MVSPKSARDGERAGHDVSAGRPTGVSQPPGAWANMESIAASTVTTTDQPNATSLPRAGRFLAVFHHRLPEMLSTRSGKAGFKLMLFRLSSCSPTVKDLRFA